MPSINDVTSTMARTWGDEPLADVDADTLKGNEHDSWNSHP
jgi:hypothetical protein